LTDTLVVEASQAGHKPKKGRREYADEQLFARLIGAAVLLAIAVIVLPFVLDGSGSQREYEYAETLPAEPAEPLVEKSFSSRQPLGPAPAPESVDVTVPKTTPLTDLEIPASAVSSEPAAAALPAFETIGTAQTAANGTQAAGSQIESISIQRGWNIQVASFIRDSNAVTLINKLRGQNLAAYANRVQGKSRSVVRVLVGPYENQIDALALQNRIDREYKVESVMVRAK